MKGPDIYRVVRAIFKKLRVSSKVFATCKREDDVAVQSKFVSIFLIWHLKFHFSFRRRLEIVFLTEQLFLLQK